MEAGKCHELPSAGWRPREASGVVKPKSKRLRTRELGVYIPV